MVGHDLLHHQGDALAFLDFHAGKRLHLLDGVHGAAPVSPEDAPGSRVLTPFALDNFLKGFASVAAHLHEDDGVEVVGHAHCCLSNGSSR